MPSTALPSTSRPWSACGFGWCRRSATRVAVPGREEAVPGREEAVPGREDTPFGGSSDEEDAVPGRGALPGRLKSEPGDAGRRCPDDGREGVCMQLLTASARAAAHQWLRPRLAQGETVVSASSRWIHHNGRPRACIATLKTA